MKAFLVLLTLCFQIAESVCFVENGDWNGIVTPLGRIERRMPTGAPRPSQNFQPQQQPQQQQQQMPANMPPQAPGGGPISFVYVTKTVVMPHPYPSNNPVATEGRPQDMPVEWGPRDKRQRQWAPQPQQPQRRRPMPMIQPPTQVPQMTMMPTPFQQQQQQQFQPRPQIVIPESNVWDSPNYRDRMLSPGMMLPPNPSMTNSIIYSTDPSVITPTLPLYTSSLSFDSLSSSPSLVYSSTFSIQPTPVGLKKQDDMKKNSTSTTTTASKTNTTTTTTTDSKISSKNNYEDQESNDDGHNDALLEKMLAFIMFSMMGVMTFL